ncbi:MAG TPA: biotin--[acetyl-CoA-carboxylase] ligase [Mycobacterium sp.]|uniref:biotin--[acetyl-CoA-carboxylase] ligase n=1 Tax=Mycolicibacterium sp. TaxID=2320850 RepID=UPI0025FEE6D3|nr:biotin--[acetyl-CoA-carboxylase] ligase [Mycolicibacterium sp.]HPX37300.1 biotin--[acetyl-CoA-carboxylase] ligase [Mycobacterium sp.]HQC77392.1 biotin--[acetyl-CoA-carboxylase] ligase [Mycobacterium sp.]
MTARAPLDVTGIRRDLVGPGRPLHDLEVVESTGSTNADLLARRAAGQDVAGTVLVAEYQSAGRGRHGRTWSAPPRSQIAFSLGVGAGGLPPATWGWLPLLTGVAVVDAVHATTGISPGLKWPNDVLAGPRDEQGKLGGILAEVAPGPDPAIVVGLGLNVTLTAPELAAVAPDPRATSLLMLGSTMLDRSALLGSILAELTARIDRWKIAGGPDAALVADYRARSVTLGSRVRALLPGDREITGTATDLDELGQLHIDTGSQTIAVSAGDITHLR